MIICAALKDTRTGQLFCGVRHAMRENANEEFFNLFCENFGRFWD